MSKYQLRRGVGVPADVVVTEFERINDEMGGVTPQVVLDAARPDDAPLHPVFMWDDSQAAERYRLWQARDLVRAVHVIGDDGEDRGSAFIRVTVNDDDGGSVYKPMSEVVNDESLFKSALSGLHAKLSGAKQAIVYLEQEAKRAGQNKNHRALSKAKQSVEQAEKHLQQLNG